jgi:hypothetical protein
MILALINEIQIQDSGRSDKQSVTIKIAMICKSVNST